MPITQTLTTSFKVQLLAGAQNFTAGTGDTYKMALYTSSATLDAATTSYTGTSNEVVGTGYTAGGNTLAISQSPTSGGTTAFISFANTSWTSASFTCRGALIYNSSPGRGNSAVAVFDFGSDKTVVAGTFTIQFPVADATNAVIRIA
jgi:hypothetical protein